MKQSSLSLFGAFAFGVLSFVSLFHNHTPGAVIMGLLSVYCMVRAEVFHRSGL